jgi:hypothetical protein
MGEGGQHGAVSSPSVVCLVGCVWEGCGVGVIFVPWAVMYTGTGGHTTTQPPCPSRDLAGAAKTGVAQLVCPNLDVSELSVGRQN